jgi:hypothetical protein
MNQETCPCQIAQIMTQILEHLPRQITQSQQSLLESSLLPAIWAFPVCRTHPDFQTIMSRALSCIQSLHFAKTKTAKVISCPHNLKILYWYLVSLIWRRQVYGNHHEWPQATELIRTVQQLWHTLYPICNTIHDQL